MKRSLVFLFLAAWLISNSGAAVTTEFYRIHSGEYITTGGFAGVHTVPLPRSDQTYLELQYDFEAGNAAMRILGDDSRTEFQRFSDGRIAGAEIVFEGEIDHPDPLIKGKANLRYAIQLGDASVEVNGSITAEDRCCDIPYDFRHANVRATILAGPPVDPVGVYDYRGYDTDGELLVTGILEILSRGNPIQGLWRLRAVAEPDGIGPQVGVGLLSGHQDGNQFSINLNPGFSDNTVRLTGVLNDASYNGEWTYSTFLGPVAQGEFVARKKTPRIIDTQMGPEGFSFFCKVGAGMLCAVEYSDSLEAETWRNLARFISDEGVKQVVDRQSPKGGRYYRLSVLDATGVGSMVGCARRLLSDHLRLPLDAVTAVRMEAREFPDSCCGCGPPEGACADVISPGHSIFLEARGAPFEVRTCGGPFFLCTEKGGVVLGQCEE